MPKLKLALGMLLVLILILGIGTRSALAEKLAEKSFRLDRESEVVLDLTAAAPDTSIRQSLTLAPRPGTNHWWSSSLPAYSPDRTSARTAARRLPRGSTSSAR